MLRPRACLERMIPAVHGGPDGEELARQGISADKLLDFSVSINPFRPPRAVYAAVRNTSIQQYPDSATTELVNALSRKTGLAAANLVAGSGSTELIRAAALAYLERNDNAITLDPTYAEYEIACRLCNAGISKFKLDEAKQFHFDASEFIRFSRPFNPRLIFLCNPNNPTGGYIEKEQVDNILAAFGNTLVVLDEAYLAFTRGAWDSISLLGHANLLIIRSMTKDYSLAGLRLGYACGHKDIIGTLKKVLPPWNVNAPAQVAGIAVLRDDSYLPRQAARIETAGRYLSHGFRKLGYHVLPSRTNFFLVKVDDATRFRDSLLKRGFLVRDCTSFGLPQYIRLAPRPLADCRRLVNAVKEMGTQV